MWATALTRVNKVSPMRPTAATTTKRKRTSSFLRLEFGGYFLELACWRKIECGTTAISRPLAHAVLIFSPCLFFLLVSFSLELAFFCLRLLLFVDSYCCFCLCCCCCCYLSFICRFLQTRTPFSNNFFFAFPRGGGWGHAIPGSCFAFPFRLDFRSFISLVC